MSALACCLSLSTYSIDIQDGPVQVTIIIQSNGYAVHDAAHKMACHDKAALRIAGHRCAIHAVVRAGWRPAKACVSHEEHVIIRREAATLDLDRKADRLVNFGRVKKDMWVCGFDVCFCRVRDVLCSNGRCAEACSDDGDGDDHTEK